MGTRVPHEALRYVKDLPCEGPGQVGLGDRPRLAGPPRAPAWDADSECLTKRVGTLCGLRRRLSPERQATRMGAAVHGGLGLTRSGVA